MAETGDATQPFPLRPTRGSSTPHLLLVFFQLFFLSSPSFAGRRWIAIGTLSILAIWAQLSPWTHNPGAANFAALAWPHWLATIEKFLNDTPTPEAALWPVDKDAGVALSYFPFGFRKLKWAVALILNLRGIRYNFQVKNVQKPRFTSTQRRGVILFILWQSMELAYFMLMGDLVAQLGMRLFFPSGPDQHGRIDMQLDIRDADWRMSFLKALVFGSGPYFFINMQYTLVSIFFVAIGVSKPEDWPPLFGRLAEATTVRSFWGKFWHQMIRKVGLPSPRPPSSLALSQLTSKKPQQPLQGLTRRIVDVVGIKRGTNTSSYMQLWFSFAISGVMHAASMTLMPCPASVSEWDRWSGLVFYFLWQAAAITFEDFVLFVWRSAFGGGGESRTWKSVVGYVWVTCSFWFSLPMAADVMLKLRMGEVSPFPWTLWGPLVEMLFPQ
ncbi:toxin biosynthesis protein [Diplodia corticola]|uniref:Toxin biosynthesis protein n=1 Tax=Diplodia corticola TaxID=236234 RepID=A0A1J9QQ10_9PEZI|nr:toxin biosynthesis protein [Diplodia corticola]OJD31014.1 toxin biosynthesis protein [Diplodia corticola]